MREIEEVKQRKKIETVGGREKKAEARVSRRQDCLKEMDEEWTGEHLPA